jgi:hypothetical protein
MTGSLSAAAGPIDKRTAARPPAASKARAMLRRTRIVTSPEVHNPVLIVLMALILIREARKKVQGGSEIIAQH